MSRARNKRHLASPIGFMGGLRLAIFVPLLMCADQGLAGNAIPNHDVPAASDGAVDSQSLHGAYQRRDQGSVIGDVFDVKEPAIQAFPIRVYPAGGTVGRGREACVTSNGKGCQKPLGQASRAPNGGTDAASRGRRQRDFERMQGENQLAAAQRQREMEERAMLAAQNAQPGPSTVNPWGAVLGAYMQHQQDKLDRDASGQQFMYQPQPQPQLQQSYGMGVVAPVPEPRRAASATPPPQPVTGTIIRGDTSIKPPQRSSTEPAPIGHIPSTCPGMKPGWTCGGVEGGFHRR